MDDEELVRHFDARLNCGLTLVSFIQAGTQFWDQTLEMEFSQVGLASLTMDRSVLGISSLSLSQQGVHVIGLCQGSALLWNMPEPSNSRNS